MEFYTTNKEYRFVPMSGLSRIVISSDIVVETEEQWEDIRKLIEKYVYDISDKKTNTETVLPVPQQESPTNNTEDEYVTVFSTIDIE